MKYILIFLISFAVFSPAYAAKVVKGTVPDLAPLQAAPAGIKANFSNNVESSAANSSAGEGGASAGAQSAAQSQSSGQAATLPDGGLASRPRNPNLLVLLLLVVVGAAALLWVWLRRNKV